MVLYDRHTRPLHHRVSGKRKGCVYGVVFYDRHTRPLQHSQWKKAQTLCMVWYCMTGIQDLSVTVIVKRLRLCVWCGIVSYVRLTRTSSTQWIEKGTACVCGVVLYDRHARPLYHRVSWKRHKLCIWWGECVQRNAVWCDVHGTMQDWEKRNRYLSPTLDHATASCANG